MTTRTDIDQLYSRHIAPLSVTDRLRLLAAIANGLSAEDRDDTPKHRLLELEGVGAELWQGTDVQEYIDRLRDEWETPS